MEMMEEVSVFRIEAGKVGVVEGRRERVTVIFREGIWSDGDLDIPREAPGYFSKFRGDCVRQ